MEIITIPYDDYKELLDYKMWYEEMEKDLLYIIEKTNLDYYKEDLNFENSKIKDFVEKHFSGTYRRLKELKENEIKEGDK